MTIPFLNSLFYRPTGKADGFGYFGFIAAPIHAFFVGADRLLMKAKKFGGFALGKVVTEPPVFESGGSHLSNQRITPKRATAVHHLNSTARNSRYLSCHGVIPHSSLALASAALAILRTLLREPNSAVELTYRSKASTSSALIALRRSRWSVSSRTANPATAFSWTALADSSGVAA